MSGGDRCDSRTVAPDSERHDSGQNGCVTAGNSGRPDDRQSDCGTAAARRGAMRRRGEREGRLRAVSCGGEGGRMGLAAETAEEVGGGFAEFWESEEVCEGYVGYAAYQYLQYQYAPTWQ